MNEKIIKISKLGFSNDLKEFFHFLRNPKLRNFPKKMGIFGLKYIFLNHAKCLFSWALFLWTVNFCIFGPIAAFVAQSKGITHKLDVLNIPWATAIFWAPIVEEMLFRYGFLRPTQSILLSPILIIILLTGPQFWSIICLFLILVCLTFLFWTNFLNQKKYLFSNFVSRKVEQYFALIFHLMTILFASIHLCNFSSIKTAYWVFPILVLPQWATGLALGWIRVRYGISSSIFLHALFNFGPIILIWIFTKLSKIILVFQ